MQSDGGWLGDAQRGATDPSAVSRAPHPTNNGGASLSTRSALPGDTGQLLALVCTLSLSLHTVLTMSVSARSPYFTLPASFLGRRQSRAPSSSIFPLASAPPPVHIPTPSLSSFAGSCTPSYTPSIADTLLDDLDDILELTPTIPRTPLSARPPKLDRPSLRSVFSLPHLRTAKTDISRRPSKRAKTGAQPVSNNGRRTGSGAPSPSFSSPSLNQASTPNPSYNAPGGSSRGVGGASGSSGGQYQYHHQQQQPSSSGFSGNGQQQGANFRPGRAAPPPPASVGGSATQGGMAIANGHVYDQNDKRASFHQQASGAARSSYAPSSGRPPYSSSNSATSSSAGFQPSRTAPPIPSNSSLSPTRGPQQPSGLSGGNWEVVDEPPAAPPKRGPPSGNSGFGAHNLRELTDALPSSASLYPQQPPSANSSASSLVVNPPTGYSHQQQRLQGHAPSQSINHSLLTDPATAAATNLSLHDGSQRPVSALVSSGPGGAGGSARTSGGDEYGSSGVGGGQPHPGSVSPGPPGTPGGSNTPGQRNSGDRDASGKEKKSKGFGGFLGAFSLFRHSLFDRR